MSIQYYENKFQEFQKIVKEINKQQKIKDEGIKAMRQAKSRVTLSGMEIRKLQQKLQDEVLNV